MTIQYLMREYPEGLRTDAKKAAELESLLWQVMGALAGASQASKTLEDMDEWEKAMLKYDCMARPKAPTVPVIPDHMFKK